MKKGYQLCIGFARKKWPIANTLLELLDSLGVEEVVTF